MNCFSKLCKLCCCKLPDDEDELSNGWGRSCFSEPSGNNNERQPLLQEDAVPPRRPEYGVVRRTERRSTGFSTVFAQPPPNDLNVYGNRNYIFLRPRSPRRFGKMRCIKPEKYRELKFPFKRRDESVFEGTSSGCSEKTTEDKMLLAKIVEETAASMIDLTIDLAGESLDRHEAGERLKWYAERLELLSPSLIQQPYVGILLADLRKPFLFHKMNSTAVISKEDVELMDWATEEIAQGLNSIRVQNGNEFVVEFPSLALAKENLEDRRADSL